MIALLHQGPPTTTALRSVFLPDALVEKLKGTAGADLTLEELIIEALGALDPDEKAEAYWEVAEHYLTKAEEELSKGDLRQASEKIWGSAALAVRAVAYKRDGRRLVSHGELWRYVSKLKEEDPSIGDLWRTAVSMHVNFYEGWAPEDEVREALSRVRELLAKLKKLMLKPRS